MAVSSSSIGLALAGLFVESPPAGHAAPPSPQGFFSSPRIGLQVGHWQAADAPRELWRLRGQTGAYAAGISEVEVNLLIAKQVKILLNNVGIVVDLLPVRIPPAYRADAFVSLHVDGAASKRAAGFKAARPLWHDRSWYYRWRRENPYARFNRDIWRRNAIIDRNPLDPALLKHIYESYGSITGLPRSPNISYRMKRYYAFNSRRYYHAISQSTPAVILEMGYLTNASDRRFLTQESAVPARGIALALINFLENERGFSATDRGPDH